MKRRLFLTAALALPVAGARAQKQGGVRRVGLLTIGVENRTEWISGLRDGLRDHNFVEGSNLKLEYRTGLTRYEQLLDAAQELVISKVHVIAPFGDTSTRAAIKVAGAIPIVFFGGADPVEAGFVKSLVRPDGNVTGITAFAQPLAGKRLEILKEVQPTLKTVAVLVEPGSRLALVSFRDMEVAAKTLGLYLTKVEIHTPQDIEPAIASAAKSGAGALATVPSSVLASHRAIIIQAAAANRLPAMYSNTEFVSSGGLMSYGVKVGEAFRRQGSYIGRILKGERPATLPVEQPTEFLFFVNMKTARALGITIPQTVLVRVDRVIE